MNYLTQNIKHLRKSNKLTQQQFADLLNIKRSLLGAYEEGRALPKIETMQKLSCQFSVSMDELYNSDLSEQKKVSAQTAAPELRILPIVTDQHNRELIPIVPVKATAGYLNGLSDPEFIGQLPVFSMPIPELAKERTYRVFQIKGDSMLPVPSGAYIFCEYVADFSELKDGQCYILITQEEGLIYKRVYQTEKGQLLLVSDNKTYAPYSISVESVRELWKARGTLSFDLD